MVTARRGAFASTILGGAASGAAELDAAGAAELDAAGAAELDADGAAGAAELDAAGAAGAALFAGVAGGSTGTGAGTGVPKLSTMVGAVSWRRGVTTAGLSVPSAAKGPVGGFFDASANFDGGSHPKRVRTIAVPTRAAAFFPKQNRRGSKDSM